MSSRPVSPFPRTVNEMPDVAPDGASATSPTISSDNPDIQKYLDQGYEIVARRPLIINGERRVEVTLEKTSTKEDDSTGKKIVTRVIDAVGGGLAAVATLGLNQSARDKAAMGITGSATETIIAPVDHRGAPEENEKLSSHEIEKLETKNNKLTEGQADLILQFLGKNKAQILPYDEIKNIIKENGSETIDQLLDWHYQAPDDHKPPASQVQELKKQFAKLEKEKVNIEEAQKTFGETQRARTIAREGFDTTSRASTRAYAKANEGKFQRMNGHAILPLYNSTGISRFIFAPNGDFSKARTMKAWDAKTGRRLTGSQFFRAMQDYATMYESIEQGWGLRITELKKDGLTDDDFKKVPMIFVIHPKNHQVRAFNRDFDPNTTNLDNSAQGLSIPIKDDETWKEVDANHKKDSTEFKKKLDDPERPYGNDEKTEAPSATPPLAFGNGSADFDNDDQSVATGPRGRSRSRKGKGPARSGPSSPARSSSLPRGE